MFWLALHGYVGTELATSAKQALKIKIHDNITKSFGGVPLRTIILLAICLAMIGSWGKYKNFVWTCTFAKSFSYFLSIMMCAFCRLFRPWSSIRKILCSQVPKMFHR
jgi:membrane-bound metal-dependent hydrolase YbcI (DUF457 family)